MEGILCQPQLEQGNYQIFKNLKINTHPIQFFEEFFVVA